VPAILVTICARVAGAVQVYHTKFKNHNTELLGVIVGASIVHPLFTVLNHTALASFEVYSAVIKLAICTIP
jgi:hypothetical protein